MYKKNTHIHFMGIGGIGMSGIATILRHQGYTISGCDLDIHRSIIQDLKNIGCTVQEGNNGPICHDTSIDILVYSSDIRVHESDEIKRAQKRTIPVIRRALMLAELMRTKYSIAISGAHGKTTTTSLIAHILIEAKRDPTVIIGGILKSISNNARSGDGEFLVAEADESDRSFLHLLPTIAVVTNLDREHLDTYTDLDDIKKTFAQFLSNIPFYGTAIVCIDDPAVRSLLPIDHIKTITYGIDTEADIQARDIQLNPDNSIFSVYDRSQETVLGTITLGIPGIHNVRNALAAIAVTRELGLSHDDIATGLKTFAGVDRRFTYRGTTKQGALVFDDYGHHPTEIQHTFMVARARAPKKLVVLFQPHRYTRTFHLFDEFVTVLSNPTIDHLVITDVYGCSEKPIEGIHGAALVAAIKKMRPSCSVSYIPYDPEWQSIRNYITPLLDDGTLLLIQGAGSLYRLGAELVAQTTPPQSLHKNILDISSIELAHKT